MSTPAIRVDGIGKRYRLGEHTSFGSLRESLMTRLRSLGHLPSGPESASLWALRDISFEVARGEAIGIIGRNGAGKSTLLKVLSRITEPTEGRAVIHGRVGSLLEVGTGFHPELTGRENIFLNGAILGMTRDETRRQFDNIVAFAEVEDFLDTPVKRYSSGMYLRLAFAVAAHLEPEILLVDEVLAVGDSNFQKKCLGKMSDVTQQGRTVLFVSHNMEAIQRLCQRTIRIDGGQIVSDGKSSEVVREYMGMDSGKDLSIPTYRAGTMVKTFSVEINNQHQKQNVSWDLDRPLSLALKCVTLEANPSLVADVTFYRLDGLRIFSVCTDIVSDTGSDQADSHSWCRFVSMICPSMARGDFYIDIGIRKPHGPYEVLWNHVTTVSTTGGGSCALVANNSLIVPEVTVDTVIPNRSDEREGL